MDNENIVNRLRQTDVINPEVLTGFQYIPLEIQPDILPPEKESTIQEIMSSFQYEAGPAWMAMFPEAVIIEIRKRFRSLHPYLEDNKIYQFSITCRLDEMTFIGSPVDGKLPILKVLLPNAVLLDSTGAGFLESLKAFNENDPTADDEFEIQIVEKEYLGENLFKHTPRLMLFETWHIISAFKELSVGNPVGSVTVVPGEDRVIHITDKSTTTITTKDNLTVLDKVSGTTTSLFQKNFDEIKKSSGDFYNEFTWSSTSTRPGTASQIGKTDINTGKRTQTIKDSLDTTLETLHSLTTVQKNSRDVTLTQDFEVVDVEEHTDDRKVTIKNETGECVTYVYHYLNNVYFTCVDLTEVALVYTGEAVNTPLQFIPLTGDIDNSLNSIIIDPLRLSEIGTLINNALQERYSQLDIFEEDTSDITLKPTPIDDVNIEIYSRTSLFGQRRSTGGLPVNLYSSLVAVQTPNLHVVPHIAEFSLPTKKDTKAEA